IGTRPAYSLTSTKVGLVARTTAPRPSTRPCTKHVLPAPSSPVSATTAPGPSLRPSRSPAASVVSASALMISAAVAMKPLERVGKSLDEVTRDQRLFADALGRDVARASVQVHARDHRRRRLHAAGQTRP